MVQVPQPSRDKICFRVGLRVAFASPKEALFTVQRFFLLPVPHFLPLPFWDRALAAAVFEAALVRPSLRTLLAADAALELVCFEFFDAIVTTTFPSSAKQHTGTDTPESFESVYTIPVGYFYISADIQRSSVAQLDTPSCTVQLGLLLVL